MRFKSDKGILSRQTIRNRQRGNDTVGGIPKTLAEYKQVIRYELHLSGLGAVRRRETGICG